MRVIAESAGKALGGTMIIGNKLSASGMLNPNDQSVLYMNTVDCTKFAQTNSLKEKAVIEKHGLALNT